jgi:hypothetical protein
LVFLINICIFIKNIDMSTSNNGEYYLISLENPNEQLQFQYIPDELKHSSTAKNGVVDIVGRSHPKRHYLGGDEKVSFALDFHAADTEIQTVKDKVFWLMSLKGQDLKLVFGRLYANIVWVLESVEVSWKFQDTAQGYPKVANINLTLSINAKRSITNEQIRNNQW